MDIQGEYLIAVAQQRVWDALLDADILSQCIPGCEQMEKVSDTEYEARVIAAIGPVKATFKTKLAMTELNPPASYSLVGESKGGAAGFGKGTADITLTESDGSTTLRYNAKFTVGGKLAQVGSRLVTGVTRKMADEFFGSFSTLMDAGAQKVMTEQDQLLLQRSSTRKRVLAAIGAGAALLVILWWAFGR